MKAFIPLTIDAQILKEFEQNCDEKNISLILEIQNLIKEQNKRDYRRRKRVYNKGELNE